MKKLLIWVAEKLLNTDAFMNSIPHCWAVRLDEFVWGDEEIAGFDCW